MKQHLPFKPDNFASWATPKLLPSIPTIATNPPSPNPSDGGNTGPLLYIGLGVLTIAIIASTVYLFNQNRQLSYQISALTFQVQNQAAAEEQETGNNNLPTDSKHENNDTTT